MNWRVDRGIGEKPIRLCPVCGVESVAGKKCRYHIHSEKRTEYHAAYYRANHAKLRPVAAERMRYNRERNRVKRDVIRALCEGIDEGRQEAMT